MKTVDFSNVLESLKVLLFGMIGIFTTMGIIMLSLVVMNSFSRNKKDDD